MKNLPIFPGRKKKRHGRIAKVAEPITKNGRRKFPT